MKKSIISLVISSMVLHGTAFEQTTLAQEHNQESLAMIWKQRTVDEIRRAINLMTEKQNEVYVIQWGDTLISISEATGISVNDLAQINQIANPDLIMAGAELRFNSNSGTISYSQGDEEVTVPAHETENSSIRTEVDSEESLLVVEKAEEFEIKDFQEELTTTSEEGLPIEVIETTLETSEEFLPAIEIDTTSTEITEEQLTTEDFETADITIESTAFINDLLETSVSDTTTSITTSVETTEEIVETTVVDNSSTDPYAAFERITAEKGVSEVEKGYWKAIINRESGWNTFAKNPSSGAYGLPQALPGNKMASHGADWQSNPYTQLSWMYDYMVNRYGSISGAWSHSQSRGWY
ncbi:LysM peptidoglycan-binding domain-containing protein [Facklamia sp. 7083-14-GEN3]|uniref:LysM peptidoglycan-binding domain-containing protein n=1 Tax=Facklamia sp. 7083-14-GEN3 TaxID=2973478 RepID=UPI00215C1F29|nr:LysM peptidoglycan-binding domain-containing protein [Facklamia sp. 7083-14-GEN3]MCR8969528.1 LysM peptidoglycan-binding domain-containing protein [Facklamia sp. 7083-14-GEN3]